MRNKQGKSGIVNLRWET